jgi:tricorn protease
VVSVEEKSATNLWVYDRDRETWTQLTGGKFSGWPIWSPGGDRVVFASNREGPQNLFVVPADGGPATRLTDTTQWQYPTGWSPDVRNFSRATLGR